MNDNQLLRYSRQILLPQIDAAGQQALLQSTILIVGLGGLGSPVAMYLAAAGLGRLILVDPDKVDLTNLQRQIIHDTSQIGEWKVFSALKRLQALNPEVQIQAEPVAFDALNFSDLPAVDAIVDCSDNFATRFKVNRYCVQQKIPLISGAALGFQGQLTVFLPGQAQSPCYHCLYPETDQPEVSCSEAGIIAPLVGIIGSLQALEVIKLQLRIGQSLCGRLLQLDAYRPTWRMVALPKDPSCPVCGDLSNT